MMRARHSAGMQTNPRSTRKESGETHQFQPAPRKSALIVFFIFFLASSFLLRVKAAAQNPVLVLSSAPGGITLSISGINQWSGQFGIMNALGIGTPFTGVSLIALSNGALYFSPYQLTVSNLPGNHTATVTGFASANFGHPAALILESCPSSSACNTSGAFSAMSTNAAAPTTVITSTGNATLTAGLAVFLPDNNGAGAFTGTDTARITFTVTDLNNNHSSTVDLRLDTPQGEIVQDAVQLTLGSAVGGLTVNPTADYSMNFGNVNGLGIGPGVGLTAVPAAGGTIYSTPYRLQPAFTGFASTTATIKVYVSTNFAHPAVLKLEDATAGAGPFTLISTNAAAQTQIAASAGDRSSITRFLGLFVSNINGPTAFTGSDSATLTFTMTVP